MGERPRLRSWRGAGQQSMQRQAKESVQQQRAHESSALQVNGGGRGGTRRKRRSFVCWSSFDSFIETRSSRSLVHGEFSFPQISKTQLREDAVSKVSKERVVAVVVNAVSARPCRYTMTNVETFGRLRDAWRTGNLTRIIRYQNVLDDRECGAKDMHRFPRVILS